MGAVWQFWEQLDESEDSTTGDDERGVSADLNGDVAIRSRVGQYKSYEGILREKGERKNKRERKKEKKRREMRANIFGVGVQVVLKTER